MTDANSTPEAPEEFAVRQEAPATIAPFTLAWYDALIADKQAIAENLFAQANQALGALAMLANMRELSEQREAGAKENGNGSNWD